jgi:nucleoside-diphosphate-sugar epimerase
MKNIAILGCGWLGFPLAKNMVANGMTVRGSTTSESKLQNLDNSDILPFRIVLHEGDVEGNVFEFLAGADILIIDVPPKAKSGENFTQKIRTLIPHIEASGIIKVLFVSSTSVYADDNSVVTEDTIPNPNTDSGKQLVECEKFLQGNNLFKTTVIRFGGLIGEDRHPVKHLAGRENISGPDAPINLIHREDCIGIILKIIEKDIWGEIFNAAAPWHPTRKDYYTQKAVEMGLPLPQFAVDGNSKGKIISSDKIVRDLGYMFTGRL